MRTREKHLWEWLELGGKELQRQGHFIELERVENCVMTGMPDVHCIILERGEFWIELKAVPRGRAINCELDADQALWHHRHTRCGGRSFVLVQVGTGTALRRYLVPGGRVSALARPIGEMALLGLAERSGGPITAADFLLLAAHS